MKSNRRQFIKGIGWVALASTFFGKIARAVTKAIQKPSATPRKNWHILNDGPIKLMVPKPGKVMKLRRYNTYSTTNAAVKQLTKDMHKSQDKLAIDAIT